MEDSEIIKKYIRINPIQYNLLKNLGDLFSLYNKKVNLISRKDIKYIYTRHILHSLSISNFVNIQNYATSLDIGTGAGLPGLPLSILFDKANFILVDSIKKKINIIKKIISLLNLKNVQAFQLRIGEQSNLSKKIFAKKFDYIFGRGVTNIRDFYKIASPLLKKNNPIKNSGIWYLRGKDVCKDEFKKINVFDIYQKIPLEFFKEKKLIHIIK